MKVLSDSSAVKDGCPRRNTGITKGAKEEFAMIHYTCDMCKRELDPTEDLRYVVKMEVYAAMDPAGDAADDDRDHMEEIQEIIARIEDDNDPNLGEDVYQQVRFDLCPECRRKFLKDPLGLEPAKAFQFSAN
jgi:hypothetical protein